MAFYPDVVPGTTFVPIASLENQVRRNINALNGIGGSAIKDKSLSTVRIRVYNNTELTLPAGTAVGFILSSALVGDAVPAEAVKDISKPWGVLADSLKPNDIGDCIISGPVTVDCTGTGAFAEPDVSTPSVFKLGGSGAPVLFSADGRALINLGSGTVQAGTFAVSVKDDKLNIAPGFLNRNGEWLTIPAVEGIEPITGWLCLCSTIENGAWTVPELRVETPSADAYPIAEIKVENDSITVRQLPVAVAMIMLAKVCPMAEF